MADLQALAALNFQMKALNASCAAFDAGERWEAMRIATAVHSIVHDMSSKKLSLLSRVGLKTGMKFAASGRPIFADNLAPSSPLTQMRMGRDEAGGYTKFLPRLDDNPDGIRWLAFTRWWDDPIWSSGSNRNLVTRKNLVFGLRNKDGGSHFDPHNREEAYTAMARGVWFFSVGSAPPVKAVGELSTAMRQIGWEVAESIKATVTFA